MRGEILGFERRRRWSDEEKQGIVMSVGVDEATVTQVAQRHEITRQQVYSWRHEMKKKGVWSPDGGALFLPFDIPAHGVPASRTRPPSRPRWRSNCACATAAACSSTATWLPWR
ncbi:hypothetical protein BV911_16250 [Pseudoruegeria sp. SK021]|nr:hypothetical protein BV911_16250 [Pseudoruegeria sp. SK021]